MKNRVIVLFLLIFGGFSFAFEINCTDLVSGKNFSLKESSLKKSEAIDSVSYSASIELDDKNTVEVQHVSSFMSYLTLKSKVGRSTVGTMGADAASLFVKNSKVNFLLSCKAQ